MMKSLHGDNAATKEQVTSIRDVVDKALLTQKQDVSKIINLVSVRQTQLEEKVDKMYVQLNEVKKSVELLLSIFLVDDVKKGERALKSNCKTDKPRGGDDDEAPNCGNKVVKSIGSNKGGKG